MTTSPNLKEFPTPEDAFESLSTNPDGIEGFYVGATVLYAISAIAIRPAIVIDCHSDGTVDLVIFTAGKRDVKWDKRYRAGLSIKYDAIYDPTGKVGCWFPHSLVNKG